MKQPPGFVDKDHPHKVWKLRKSLYGLRQSSRTWYTTLHSFLTQQGFVRSDYESCLYVHRNSSTGEETMVAVYVDDLVISVAVILLLCVILNSLLRPGSKSRTLVLSLKFSVLRWSGILQQVLLSQSGFFCERCD